MKLRLMHLIAVAVSLALLSTSGNFAYANGDDGDRGEERREAAAEKRDRKQKEAESRRNRGLNSAAKRELKAAGLDKYLYKFRPASSEPFAQDWVKHTFDPEDGDGPICIAGTDYSMFTKAGDPDKLIIFLQGGGACWEDFAACNVTAEAQFPPPAQFLPGVFAKSSADGTIDNDLGDWSVAYLPYCDGSVFIGDNDVEEDPLFGVRRHRGLRNLTAGLNVARKEFGKPDKILVAGSSAGGVGSAVFTPFLTRMLFGNKVDLFVFNDAGPVALDVSKAPDAAAARLNDWKFEQFFPQSCVDQGLCDPFGQQTGLIQWRLDNDSTIREAFYETDADATNLGFAQANIPGTPPFVPISQLEYREVLEANHDPLNAAYPDRYKRYIISGGNPLCDGLVAYSHTGLQGGNLGSFGCPTSSVYYDLSSEGVSLWKWTNDFVSGGENWIDIVEPFTPAPPR